MLVVTTLVIGLWIVLRDARREPVCPKPEPWEPVQFDSEGCIR
jgi:hypothetical protein